MPPSSTWQSSSSSNNLHSTSLALFCTIVGSGAVVFLRSFSTLLVFGGLKIDWGPCCHFLWSICLKWYHSAAAVTHHRNSQMTPHPGQQYQSQGGKRWYLHLVTRETHLIVSRPRTTPFQIPVRSRPSSSCCETFYALFSDSHWSEAISHQNSILTITFSPRALFIAHLIQKVLFPSLRSVGQVCCPT